MEKDIVTNLTHVGQILLKRFYYGAKLMEFRGFSLELYAILWKTTPEKIVEATNDMQERHIIRTMMNVSGEVYYMACSTYYAAAVEVLGD